GNTCVTDNEGYVYLAGVSGGSTSTVIASPGAHQTIPSGQNDAFLVKFFGCEGELNVSSSSTGGCFGVSPASASVNVSGGIGYTYTWVPIGGNTNIASNLTTGTYTCFINNVCATDTSQIFNIVQPTASLTSIVISTSTLLCVGETATLTLNTNGGVSPYSYLWSVSGNTTSGIVVSPTITTTYTITTTDINNCVSTATTIQNVDACVGIEEINDIKNEMLIYPNPNNGRFYISEFENNIGKDVEIFNCLGQLVKRVQIESTVQQINFNNYPAGFYFVQISDGGIILNVSKFIKE
nr:T9SS type A sorting domain-containing protein [Bacteroidota bacterium]